MKTFLMDAEKCTGCSLCIIACKDEHVYSSYAPWTKPQAETGHFWMDVKPVERGSVPRVRMNYLPLLCQHCANAPCMKVCEHDAVKRRDDGLVWIDPAICTGCGDCQEACPYDVIYINEELNLAQKCTGCAHLVDAGLQPRCVDICPHGAILFGDAKTLLKQAKGDKPHEAYHAEYQTEPLVRWNGLPKPRVAGAVIDVASDEVITDATITARDLIKDTSVTVQSDAFGEFWIRDLATARKYRIEITKKGYQDFHAILTINGDQDLGTVFLQRAR